MAVTSCASGAGGHGRILTSGVENGMTEVGYHDEHLAVQVEGGTRRYIVRTPERLATDPALVFFLGADQHRTLDEASFRIFPDHILAGGHRVVGFDLPNHGD